MFFLLNIERVEKHYTISPDRTRLVILNSWHIAFIDPRERVNRAELTSKMFRPRCIIRYTRYTVLLDNYAV